VLSKLFPIFPFFFLFLDWIFNAQVNMYSIFVQGFVCVNIFRVDNL
jgi:hypothetical protein